MRTCFFRSLFFVVVVAVVGDAVVGVMNTVIAAVDTVFDVTADVGVADVVNVVQVLWVKLSILLMDFVRHLSLNTVVVITRNKYVMLLIAFIQRYSRFPADSLSTLSTINMERTVHNEQREITRCHTGHGEITHCPQ